MREEGDRMNKVVVRFADGRMLKGVTADFVPAKDQFHVSDRSAPVGTRPVVVNTKELKALFFVKDYAGDPRHSDRKKFDPARASVGRRIKAVFKDGEVLVGTTQGYQPGRPGFFLVPADPDSNNERCYVVAAATRQIAFV